MEATQYWIRHDFEGTDTGATEPADEAADKIVQGALIATQILNPGGSTNIRFVARPFEEQLEIRTTWRASPMHEPIWARMARITEKRSEDLRGIVEGVEWAAHQSVVRLLNPISLLEHGLQATEPLIRLLLFTAGIDMLMMAPQKSVFIERVSRFLGADAFVFPLGGYMGTQPEYRVAQVVEDVYDLRNLIAHGQAATKKFLQTTGFRAVNGGNALKADWQYLHVLSECAAFLLCGALERALTEQDLRAAVGSDKDWRQRLNG